MKTILYNGKIRIGKDRFAQALAIEDGIISHVGTNESVLGKQASGCDFIAADPVVADVALFDLGGRLALPGFNDSHMHFLAVGQAYSQIDLGGTKSIEKAIALCKKTVEEGRCGTGWIQCFGWNDDNWEEKRFLNRHDLDRIAKDRPVIAIRVCTHICALNSKALEILGFDKNSPQPEKGNFYTDEAGVPTGIFCEMLPQIYAAMPSPDTEEIKEMLLAAGKAAAAKGLTSVQTDDLCSIPGESRKAVLQAYRSLEQSGDLPVRVYEQCRAMTTEEYDALRQMETNWPETAKRNTEDTPGERARRTFLLGPLKTFCDGSLGARTAWLSEPYSDAPQTKGISIYKDSDVLNDLVAKAHHDGVSVAIHCIGDGAAEQALNAIEAAMKTYPEMNRSVRHGIVHAQILNEELIERMARLSVIAYIQPVFLEYDLHMAEERIGAKRLENSYHFRKLYDQGICIPFGTDSPVESFDPMKNVYCAVTGKDFDGFPENGWHKEKLLTLDEAITCYTEHSTYASFDDERKGKLEPGYLADITVMEDDLFSMEADDIKDAKVYMTFMGGKVTYQRA